MTSTASGLMNTKVIKCIFCRKDHMSAEHKWSYQRTIIDTGSERSYINKYTALEIEFDPIKMK